MDDDDLIRNAAAGDAGAFEALVRRHTEAAWRMARSMLRDDFAAEEAVQDTFLKASRNLGSFRGEAKVSTWILSICRRTCLDRLRLKRVDVVPLERVAEPHAGVRDARAHQPDQADLKIALENALGGLAEHERDAFVVVEVLGYTREEAAELAGVPASTMRSRVTRAKEKLARALGEARAKATGD